MGETSQVLRAMRGLLPTFEHALSSFAASSANVQIVRSLRSPSIADSIAPGTSSGPACKTLYILDSSFNPPSRAHGQIAATALQEDRGADPKRLLLLLATQNADKATSPAPFSHRLALMTLFASDLLEKLSSTSSPAPIIDVGITKFPFFHDKSAALRESPYYKSNPPPEQVHLIGFDTVTRILNPKYYAPSYTLAPVAEFLTKERLRVSYRPDDGWGGKEEQDAYLRDLAEGRREHEGGKREWAKSFEFTEPLNSKDDVVSSTKIREAAKRGDGKALANLCTKSVADWILYEHLYTA
ncbi:MAG: pH-response regulator protein palA/rim20 [Chaenotheca gracillima]|nr:MAG: pH-response regulator protein palA/rim20 [Chaenotheca gracillima]